MALLPLAVSKMSRFESRRVPSTPPPGVPRTLVGVFTAGARYPVPAATRETNSTAASRSIVELAQPHSRVRSETTPGLPRLVTFAAQIRAERRRSSDLLPSHDLCGCVERSLQRFISGTSSSRTRLFGDRLRRGWVEGGMHEEILGLR